MLYQEPAADSTGPTLDLPSRPRPTAAHPTPILGTKIKAVFGSPGRARKKLLPGPSQQQLNYKIRSRRPHLPHWHLPTSRQRRRLGLATVKLFGVAQSIWCSSVPTTRRKLPGWDRPPSSGHFRYSTSCHSLVVARPIQKPTRPANRVSCRRQS